MLHEMENIHLEKVEKRERQAAPARVEDPAEDDEYVDAEEDEENEAAMGALESGSPPVFAARRESAEGMAGGPCRRHSFTAARPVQRKSACCTFCMAPTEFCCLHCVVNACANCKERTLSEPSTEPRSSPDTGSTVEKIVISTSFSTVPSPEAKRPCNGLDGAGSPDTADVVLPNIVGAANPNVVPPLHHAELAIVEVLARLTAKVEREVSETLTQLHDCTALPQVKSDCAMSAMKAMRTECGGASICKHVRKRSRCKEGGGISICEHGRQRSMCKECGGASFCEHGRRRSSCKECGGVSICEHGRQRSRCKECGGGFYL